MVALIYLSAAVACGWLALRAWMERANPATTAFAALCVQTGLSFLLFALYLSGVGALRYPYTALVALLPVTTEGVLERLLGDVFPSRSLMKSRVAMGTTALGYLVAAPLLGGRAGAVPDLLIGVAGMLAFTLPVRRLYREQRDAPTMAARARARILLGLLAGALLFAGLEMVSRALAPASRASRDVVGALAYAWALQGDLPPLSAVAWLSFLYVLSRVVAGALDVREIAARAFTLAGASLALVLVQGIALDAIGNPSSFWTHRTFLLFLVAFAFLSFYEPILRRLTQSAGEWFNRPGWRLQETLLESDRALAKVLSMEGLKPALLEPLSGSGRAPHVGLYLWQHELGLYRAVLESGSPEQGALRAIGPRPFTDGFNRGSEAYVRDALRRVVRRMAPGHEEAADRLRVMDAMDVDLVLPFVSGGAVLGWLAIKAQDPTEGFGPDEIRRLRATTDRVATVLENLASMEQLSEQRRLAALGTMAAGLAHEIRNPLAGIKGAAQYLQGEARPEEAVDFLEIIVDEVNRLNEVVSQFLDYARPLKVSREPAAAGALVRTVMEIVRREGLPGDLVLRAELPDDLPEILIDRDKIKQVLLNLVQNAVQAVGAHPGEVVVSAGLQRVRGQEGRVEEALTLSVTDTGRGIADEDMEKLFVPFFTTRQGGTGLGLAISQRLVQAHGGDIAVRTRPGGPTTFTVRLPRYPEVSLPLFAPVTDEPRSPSIPR